MGYLVRWVPASKSSNLIRQHTNKEGMGQKDAPFSSYLAVPVTLLPHHQCWQYFIFLIRNIYWPRTSAGVNQLSTILHFIPSEDLTLYYCYSLPPFCLLNQYLYPFQVVKKGDLYLQSIVFLSVQHISDLSQWSLQNATSPLALSVHFTSIIRLD